LRAASVEIERLFAADQADRAGGGIDGATMRKADLRRRARVAELFAGGCLSKAGDFANAALIFQHGDVPEHFFQAYVWAHRAVELGDEAAGELVGLALDRYLVRTGGNSSSDPRRCGVPRRGAGAWLTSRPTFRMSCASSTSTRRWRSSSSRYAD